MDRKTSRQFVQIAVARDWMSSRPDSIYALDGEGNVWVYRQSTMIPIDRDFWLPLSETRNQLLKGGD